ncbi:hypothetical protein [Spiroplasma culicicola]|uniref:hypothetical protein n=1 Tax=Spiroplasma culicicola TaxID=216935 RepID=UPI00046C9619|nr:hypothetical protein [Spiroplasma culicicola]
MDTKIKLKWKFNGHFFKTLLTIFGFGIFFSLVYSSLYSNLIRNSLASSIILFWAYWRILFITFSLHLIGWVFKFGVKNKNKRFEIIRKNLFFFACVFILFLSAYNPNVQNYKQFNFLSIILFSIAISSYFLNRWIYKRFNQIKCIYWKTLFIKTLKRITKQYFWAVANKINNFLVKVKILTRKSINFFVTNYKKTILIKLSHEIKGDLVDYQNNFINNSDLAIRS